MTEAFLETNGFELTMVNEEIVNFFLAIASNSLSREQVEQREIKLGQQIKAVLRSGERGRTRLREGLSMIRDLTYRATLVRVTQLTRAAHDC